MTDLSENIGSLIGSVLAGIGAFLSWFYQSGLLATLVGIIIGVIITDFVQKRTQKRVWKREYLIKTTEQVYGDLFGEMRSIIESLQNKHYEYLEFPQWGQIQNNHKYFMIDNEFRKILDSFFERTKNFNEHWSTLSTQVIPRIQRISAKEMLNREAEDTPQMTLKCMVRKRPQSYDVFTPTYLKGLKTLSDISENELRYLDKTEVSDITFSIRFTTLDTTKTIPLAPPKMIWVEYGGNQEAIPRYWNLCLQMMKEDDVYGWVVNENEKLLEEATIVKKALEKRIQEPWKI